MKKTEIIAEIGQAHDGSLGILHSYIDALSKIGVNTVKFQMHIAEYESSVYEKFRKKFSYVDQTRFDYWKRMSFSFEQWEEIYLHCEENDIEFLCSPFSIKAIDLLEKLDVKRYKIASGEVTNSLMLTILGQTKKPILISSGMSSFKELDHAFELLSNTGNKISIFHCTTAYPTPVEKIGINNILKLKSRYKVPIGLSDHSGSIYPALNAVALGAELIETHITFHKQIFGPDSSSSLDFDQLQQLLEGVRYIDKLTSNPTDKDMLSEEFSGLKTLFGKSLSAKKNINVGEIISIEVLETTKPGNKGISAQHFREVIGKKANKSINKHSFINHSDLD